MKALENLCNDDRNIVEIGKDLNDEDTIKIFTNEIKDIDNLMTKIIGGLYD